MLLLWKGEVDKKEVRWMEEENSKIKPLEEELGLSKKIVEKLEEQKGIVLSELLERFLVMRNWKEINPPPEYWEFEYKPDPTYLAMLVRDLAVEIIKIKEKLKMI